MCIPCTEEFLRERYKELVVRYVSLINDISLFFYLNRLILRVWTYKSFLKKKESSFKKFIKSIAEEF